MQPRIRRGLALPIALAGIVLVGVLAASGIFLAAQERRAGESAAVADRAFAAAELALGGTMEGWDGHVAAALKIGQGWRRDVPVKGAEAAVEVTRLGERTFWAVAVGRASRGSTWSQRRLNGVLRLDVPRPLLRAALTTGGPVSLAAGARVSGLPGPGCGYDEEPDPVVTGPVESDAADGPVAGLVVADDGDARGDRSAVLGHPPIVVDPVLVAGLLAPGSAVRTALIDRASVVLPANAVPLLTRPAGTPDSCDVARSTNWGEPQRTGGIGGCTGYRRIVHARGDLRLEGDHRGQGVLLVDGSLAIPGRLTYRGLILVRGRIVVEGALDLRGVALALPEAGDGPGSWLGPGSVVQYEQCEMERALTVAGWPAIARDRGWADLF